MKTTILIAALLCAVSAIPVPEESPRNIELINLPLKGGKVRKFRFIYVRFVYEIRHTFE
jgi:hypothetical protein